MEENHFTRVSDIGLSPLSYLGVETECADGGKLFPPGELPRRRSRGNIIFRGAFSATARSRNFRMRMSAAVRFSAVAPPGGRRGNNPPERFEGFHRAPRGGHRGINAQ